MKKAILLVAYGAGNPAARAGLRAFEERCRLSFPGWPLRWAYSSPLLRERIARQRQKSDSVHKALLRLHYENFRAIALQPLQMIPGREYGEILAAAAAAREETGLAIAAGAPLLATDRSASPVAAALLRHLPPEREAGEAVVFMAHGAKHAAAAMYGSLARELQALDGCLHLGVMSGSLTLEAILPRLRSPVVWLLPLLSVIGRHALQDMAGGQAGSWRARIEAAGHVCRPVLRGASEYEGLAQIWLERLRQAVAALDS